jgi:prepilin-type N-terminal cleavage/methylation domain-containing protein
VRWRGRLSDESGFTISEMLVVLLILSVVLGALAQLFVSSMRTEIDQTKRFQAQQEGRLALDALRREIHCANAVSSPSGTFPSSAVTVALGSYCTTSGGTAANVLWCTTGSGTSYSLWRTTQATCTGGVKKASYLTTGLVFTGLAPAGSGQKAKLSIDLPVDLDPATAGGLYELKDDIVLRNTSR